MNLVLFRYFSDFIQVIELNEVVAAPSKLLFTITKYNRYLIFGNTSHNLTIIGTVSNSAISASFIKNQHRIHFQALFNFINNPRSYKQTLQSPNSCSLLKN